jgi:hypothetical protein
MRILLIKHAGRGAAGIAVLLALSSMVVHPFGTPKRIDGHKLPVDDLRPSPEVAAILKRSCVDCHSNQTVWPWYSYVAPVSWLVERDVRHGRDYMNLSTWDEYSFNQREKLLADIASAVKNREMPLPQYTLVHRDAGLSEADADTVYNWARAERRRVKTLHSVTPPAGNPRTAAPVSSLGSSTHFVSNR